MRRNILKILLAAFSFVVLPMNVFAFGGFGGILAPTPTPAVCEGAVVAGVCVNTFKPFAGVASRGLISALAQIFDILFLLLAIFWVFIVLINVGGFVTSQGDAGRMEQSQTNITNIFKGISFGLLASILISVIGMAFGAGNPFEWPDNFAQCGPDHEIYLGAKERIVNDVKVAFAVSSVNIYCCEDRGYLPDIGGTTLSTDPKCELFKTESTV